MGNPSDGFYGKTIALSISNFWADVTIFESAKLVHTYFVKLAHTECWILYSGGLWRGFWFGDLVDLVNITKLKTCQYRYLHAPIALRIQIIKFNTYVESQFAKFNTRQTFPLVEFLSFCFPFSAQKLTLHPLNDPTEFGSLSDLYGISRKEG